MRCALILGLLALTGCAGGSTPPPMPPAPSTWTATNGTVAVTAAAAFGAAVVSVTDGLGRQYVNTADHGREFQTAYQLDGTGEVENPTEAGSAADGAGTSSTTVIGAVSVAGNVLSTSVHPAYWNAYQGATVSPDTISKTVTIGYNGMANVTRWDVTITTAADHSTGAFEGLTGYTPVLPNLYVQQADGSWLNTGMTAAQGWVQWQAPIIEASADGSQAVGLYSPGFSYWWAIIDWAGVDKWDCAYWVQTPLPAGTYQATCYVAVGTLAEVEASLAALEAKT